MLRGHISNLSSLSSGIALLQPWTQGRGGKKVIDMFRTHLKNSWSPGTCKGSGGGRGNSKYFVIILVGEGETDLYKYLPSDFYSLKECCRARVLIAIKSLLYLKKNKYGLVNSLGHIFLETNSYSVAVVHCFLLGDPNTSCPSRLWIVQYLGNSGDR